MKLDMPTKVYKVTNEWTQDVIEEVLLTEEEAEDFVDLLVEQDEHAGVPASKDEWLIEEISVDDLYDKTTILDADNGRMWCVKRRWKELIEYVDPETSEEMYFTADEIKKRTGYHADDVREAFEVLSLALKQLEYKEAENE